MTRAGRLPNFAQRRLDDLIEKRKTTGLTRDEERELSGALDYIDEKSAAMLRHFSGRQGKTA
jgi:hypothetical protein